MKVKVFIIINNKKYQWSENIADNGNLDKSLKEAFKIALKAFQSLLLGK